MTTAPSGPASPDPPTPSSSPASPSAPEVGSGRGLRSHLPVAAALSAIVAVALAIRATLINGTNEDVEIFEEWLGALRAAGGFGGLGDDISTYPPLWSYLVLASDALFGGLRDTFVLKAPAIAADVVGAGYVYALVRLRRPTGWAPTFAFAAVLLAPTVAVNSAYWGQIDMLWVAPVVACVYYVARERPVAAFVALGIGLAVKQQALFVVPFLVVLALRGRLPWRWFAIPVGVYVVSVLPAWAAGRSLRDLLLIYRDQAGQFEQLTLHASSVYAFVPDRFSIAVDRPATLWSLAALALLTAAAAVALRDLDSLDVRVALATASVLAAPVLLPYMHDRYLFAADVLAIALAFVVPELAWVALVMQVVSFSNGAYFLFRAEPFPQPVLAVVNLVSLALLALWLARHATGDAPRSRPRAARAG